MSSHSAIPATRSDAMRRDATFATRRPRPRANICAFGAHLHAPRSRCIALRCALRAVLVGGREHGVCVISAGRSYDWPAKDTVLSRSAHLALPFSRRFRGLSPSSLSLFRSSPVRIEGHDREKSSFRRLRIRDSCASPLQNASEPLNLIATRCFR